MMHALYLVLLLISISGLALLDRRFRLAFWHSPRGTIFTLGVGIGVFILWDMLGIVTGIFIHGSGPFNFAFTIAPQFPVEEIFFLFLLCYSALVIYRGVERWRSRT